MYHKQEIQDLKLRGYTKAEIITYYEGLGMKPSSRPTISKYYGMDVVPDEPGEKLAKDWKRVFKPEAHRERTGRKRIPEDENLLL